MTANVLRVCAVADFEALSCPFSTMFLRSTDLRFTPATAIAKYTLL